MAYKYTLELLAGLAILGFCGIFLYTNAMMNGAEFSGSDDAGSGLIANLTGTPVGEFKPLIPQWVPPGDEIEACLFALQAAIGGILIGGVFGYWLGQSRKKELP